MKTRRYAAPAVKGLNTLGQCIIYGEPLYTIPKLARAKTVTKLHYKYTTIYCTPFVSLTLHSYPLIIMCGHTHHHDVMTLLIGKLTPRDVNTGTCWLTGYMAVT